MNQYLYKLSLIPRLHDDSAWTEADNQIITDHFNHLKTHCDAGTVILAGRTLNAAKHAFGIVIFEAETDEAAEAFMNQDPAITRGIMTGELFPYHVALIKQTTVG
ncbi:MAG: hypothetical protein D6675_00170 [Gemmatimonadetes bacterium]|nr:MAG: hypothetical protein D6675_00170 [Gemmatimonadota bacterium]